MRENAIYFMLGLARRAGHLHSGDAAVRTAVARKKACLLLVTEDAAQRTVKIFEELSLSTGIPLIRYGSKVAVGKAIGKPQRAVVAVTDKNMAQGLLRAWERGEA